jgi:hypothetical protein
MQSQQATSTVSRQEAKLKYVKPSGRPTREHSTVSERRFGRRVEALFKTLSADYLLREQFVTDPAQVLSEYVGGAHISDERSDAANQLLYAVLSNPRLRDWMTSYSRTLSGEVPGRDAFARAFAKAVASYGDEAIALALIRGAADGRDHFTLQSDLLRALTVVMAAGRASSGTEMSSSGDPELSPDAFHAEASPAGFRRAGTEMSPGTGTEMSPGTLRPSTEVSPGGTEVSPGTGTGNEMRPGARRAGTEMSPGTGTEMSPGGLVSRGGIAGHVQVTLQALVQYASQLRARGALAFTGLEGR